VQTVGNCRQHRDGKFCATWQSVRATLTDARAEDSGAERRFDGEDLGVSVLHPAETEQK
jgi:hypothetical protein